MGTKKLYEYVNDNPNIEMYTVDYVRGSKMSKGGKAIIAMTSTANKGKNPK